MTKMLRGSAKALAASSATLTVGCSFSLHPTSISNYQRKGKVRIPFVLIAVIVLSLTSQCTLGFEEYQEHTHRHHHLLPARSHHRVIRREKKSDRTVLSALNRCNESYPNKLELIMEELDSKHENMENIEAEKSTPPPEKFNEELNKVSEMYRKHKPSPSSDKDNDEDEGLEDMTSHTGNIEWKPPSKLLDQQDATFRMLDKQINCPKSKQVLHWHPFGDAIKYHDSSIELHNLTLRAGDGRLVWNKENGERHVYEKNDYCVWKHKRDWVSFKVCLPNCSDRSPCIRKCCAPWEIVDAQTKGCTPSNPEWQPKFYKTVGALNQTETHVRDGPNASVIFPNGFPSCKNKYLINGDLKHKLLVNGTLVYVEDEERTYIHPGDFCIDGLYFGSESKSEERVFPGTEWNQVVIACTPNTYRQQLEHIRIRIYAILNFISAVFLLFTDAVYILIWRHQNNIHSWLQFSYATSLLFTFTTFAIVQIWSEDMLQFSSLCKTMGWITHFTYLSAFFWLTSMNFDLYWRFSRPLRSTRIQTQDKKRRRFLGFAAFSTVTPLLISCIGIVLDYIYTNEDSVLEPPITVPGFGIEKCYFKNKRAQIPYLYFPAGMLLLVDFIFFASTVLHLRKMHTHTELARTQSTSTMEDKKGVKVIAKLFVVMGVLWLFELLSWICQLIFTSQEHELIILYIFIPIDCINSIQGVFIFFIFICKPTVRNHLYALFRKDDAAKTWNKPTQLPSESTVQQPVVKQNGHVEIKK